MDSVWMIAWDTLSSQNPLGLVFAVLIGSALGSFANVVIHRLPREQSLVKPGSRCPHCGKPIPPKYNLPVLGYLILRGRSKCCNQQISPRYFIVELLGALILGSLYFLDGFGARFLFHAGWMILLLILAAVDWEHYRLPNSLIAAGFLLSLLWMLIAPEQSWKSATFGLLAAAVAASALMLSSKMIKGHWGGMGDVKLMLVLGITFGPGRFFFFFLTALLTAAVGFLFFSKVFREGRLPMGPFFALAFWITIWVGDEVVRWYAGLLSG